ncbi:MAG: PAS domain S-box protein [Spirochaetales bacterium]|nr:PAS domain S-box protein [Spirochaetales bacterium]
MEEFEKFGRKFYESLVHQEIMELDYQLKKKDGTLIWTSVSGKAIDHNSPPDLKKGVLRVIRDISERKEAESFPFEKDMADLWRL